MQGGRRIVFEKEIKLKTIVSAVSRDGRYLLTIITSDYLSHGETNLKVYNVGVALLMCITKCDFMILM